MSKEDVQAEFSLTGKKLSNCQFKFKLQLNFKCSVQQSANRDVVATGHHEQCCNREMDR